MEITAGGLLEIRITPADVGKRVSVRRVESERSGSPAFRDTVGVLTSWNQGVLTITRRTGESVHIAESTLVAGKIVPAAPARRRGPAASFEELSRICARSWQPLESESLGDWTLRAARGFTRRANSVLPLGDPGIPLDEALERVTSWYAERGLPAYVQAATGAAGTQELLCAELEARGWAAEVSAEVRVAGLAPVADVDCAAAREVRLTRAPDADWLGRYGRVEDPGVARRMLVEGPSVWFANLAGGRAVGRCVVDGRWAGFAAVTVDPAHRRGGLATAVMAALAGRALEEGASAAWLQVETDNAGALALYDGMGFATHHAYHHYRPAAR
ncbi:GNAT family N-acetyltransferase [Streptomyces sp. NPDC060031]|uniref:GNAT family N-acetyltransferase n=1 Tax=Streptomyces sp. NPDC060031 TaxID=3347043 RepID=UPI0036C0EFAC